MYAENSCSNIICQWSLHDLCIIPNINYEIYREWREIFLERVTSFYADSVCEELKLEGLVNC